MQLNSVETKLLTQRHDKASIPSLCSTVYVIRTVFASVLNCTTEEFVHSLPNRSTLSFSYKKNTNTKFIVVLFLFLLSKWVINNTNIFYFFSSKHYFVIYFWKMYLHGGLLLFLLLLLLWLPSLKWSEKSLCIYFLYFIILYRQENKMIVNTDKWMLIDQ